MNSRTAQLRSKENQDSRPPRPAPPQGAHLLLQRARLVALLDLQLLHVALHILLGGSAVRRWAGGRGAGWSEDANKGGVMSHQRQQQQQQPPAVAVAPGLRDAKSPLTEKVSVPEKGISPLLEEMTDKEYVSVFMDRLCVTTA